MATCRLCLNIPAEIYIFDNSRNLLPKFLSYCKLKMYKNDGLPEYVCTGCVRRLEEVVRFINQCEESDWLLRSNLYTDCVSIDKIKKSESEEECEIKEEFCDSFDDENIPRVLDEENITIDEDSITIKHENSITIKHEKSTTLKDEKSTIQKDEKSTTQKDEKSTTRKKKINNDNEKNKQQERKIGKVGDIKGLLCPVCGKLYPRGRCYGEHMKTHGERKLQCDICPKKFCTRTALSAHKITHRNIRKFKCEYCEKTFKQNHECNKHMNYVHRRSKSYPCKICDKIFYYPMGLKEHTLVHTRERKFECDKCKKCFITTYQFKSHLRVHTGERPYACRFCTKKFTMLQGLKEHERLHTGEKPYKCPTCLKGFAQRGNMKSHFKYNHKEMDYKTAAKAARANQSST